MRIILLFYHHSKCRSLYFNVILFAIMKKLWNFSFLFFPCCYFHLVLTAEHRNDDDDTLIPWICRKIPFSSFSRFLLSQMKSWLMREELGGSGDSGRKTSLGWHLRFPRNRKLKMDSINNCQQLCWKQ